MILGSNLQQSIFLHVGASSQGGIGLNHDPVLLTVGNKFRLIPQGMNFNLINSRNNPGTGKKFFQLRNIKVADADGFGATGFINLFKMLPGIQIAAGNRPVDQIKVHVIQLKTFQASGKCTLYIAYTLSGIPNLSGDKQLFPRYRGGLDCPSHAVFVFIGGSSVNQPVASSKGMGDSSFHFIFTGGSVNTQTAQRHLLVIVQGNCWNCRIHETPPLNLFSIP